MNTYSGRPNKRKPTILEFRVTYIFMFTKSSLYEHDIMGIRDMITHRGTSNVQKVENLFA